MNYAIIAAGEGSRLAAGGITVPKPLVTIGGRPVIGRLLDIFIRNGATSINIIVNEENKQTQEYLNALRLPVPLNIVVKSTPGSMHSLCALKPFLQDAPFCLTTVDTVFREEEFTTYIDAFRKDEQLDGLMAVTDFVDDEKPLYVKAGRGMRITGFYDEQPDDVNALCLVSGGVYCLKPSIWPVLEQVMQHGNTRMRDFQRGLIDAGLSLQAFPFSKIVDIDHAADIPVAEELVGSKQCAVRNNK